MDAVNVEGGVVVVVKDVVVVDVVVDVVDVNAGGVTSFESGPTKDRLYS